MASKTVTRSIIGGVKVKSKVMLPETRVVLPENFSEVARNLIMLSNNPNVLIALASFHQIFNNKIHFTHLSCLFCFIKA